MSVDLLHEKIRKMKNPSVIDFGVKRDAIPPHILEEEGSFLAAYGRFCRELMLALRDTVPAVRLSFSTFALLGEEGLGILKKLLAEAGELGYYVILDAPEILSPWAADRVADALCAEDAYAFHGLLISSFIGSDAIRPFLPYCKDGSKALFAVVRSANKSAVELQDLLTGSRLMHIASADIVNRHAETVLAKCGYSRICGVASAGAADSLRNLRTKYNRLFLLVDGLDYPSGNAKNCSYAFDRFGYGAAVCAGPSVTAAWKEGESDGSDYLECARQAADRMKKNITRYINIL